MRPKKVQTEMAFGTVPAYGRYDLFMERYRSASDFIRRAHRGVDNLRVLDVGSGDGYLKRFCSFGDIDWHGVEISKSRSDKCRDLGYEMHGCDVETDPLPFGGESFDVAVASHVLEHLADPAFALNEMHRVLKPGGLLIVGVPIKPFPFSYLRQLILRLRRPPKGGTRWAFDIYSFKSYLRRCLDGRCDLVDIRGFRFITARRMTDWENSRAFYRWNVWFGKVCPGLTREINAVLRKRGGLP